ncbi:methylmalonyl-CoA epimerase [Candidatus Bathyarchaeota archaeon]|nr:MAG: methylmalonyl-CoA epimerase [Candidatus Bathyarchaeota archaeon]
MIKKISHIGIAVKNLDEAIKLYQEVFGLKVENIEVVEEQKVRIAFIPIGESRIELLESTDPEGPIAKFIENRGEGIQHIAFETDNVENELTKLKEKGLRLIDEKPRRGARNAKIAFIHPKSIHGVLLELCEEE